eukprot:2676160-Amphidinium_carterae.1
MSAAARWLMFSQLPPRNNCARIDLAPPLALSFVVTSSTRCEQRQACEQFGRSLRHSVHFSMFKDSTPDALVTNLSPVSALASTPRGRA